MECVQVVELPQSAAALHPAKPVRSKVLDGLRGWASLSVVCYHVFWEMFSQLAPGFHNPITGFLFDGALAVAIFFILSGEALSAAFFAGKGRMSVIKLAIKRYPRLTIPILATCLITFILFRLGFLFNAEAGQIIGRHDWLGSWLGFSFDLRYVFRYALFSVYVSNDSTTALNAFLWTMRLELFGSAVVFAFLLVFNWLRSAWLVLAALTVLLGFATPSHNLACFGVGVAIAAARSRGIFDDLQRLPLAPVVTWTAIAVVAIGDGLLKRNGMSHASTAPFFAVPLVLAIFCNPAASSFFASPPLQLLGRLSFPLYLVQFPVLVSFSSWAIVYAAHHGGLSTSSMWLISGSSLAMCLVAAALFEPVELFTKWVGQRLVNVIPLRPAAFARIRL